MQNASNGLASEIVESKTDNVVNNDEINEKEVLQLKTEEVGDKNDHCDNENKVLSERNDDDSGRWGDDNVNTDIDYDINDDNINENSIELTETKPAIMSIGESLKQAEDKYTPVK